jgi:hypothetical protein
MAEEKKFRVESDLLGELKVPAEALYGVQTQTYEHDFLRVIIRQILINLLMQSLQISRLTLGISSLHQCKGMRTSLSTWYRVAQVHLST